MFNILVCVYIVKQDRKGYMLLLMYNKEMNESAKRERTGMRALGRARFIVPSGVANWSFVGG